VCVCHAGAIYECHAEISVSAAAACVITRAKGTLD